jgi:hypothetical protein
MKVRRPIVRSFRSRYLNEAARHVRAGGHAVVWERPDRALFVAPVPKKDDETDLALWALLDLGIDSWDVARGGPLDGLATKQLPADCQDIVRQRAERDSVHPGATLAMLLDCRACAACCKSNEVLLEKEDLTRLARANLHHLAKRPWARRRRDGKIVLVLTPDKRCKHLGRGNLCDIYEHRPNACRHFPPGSECCLFSRDEELGG